MKDLKQADRGVSMKQQYQITDLPKSGYPLVYNSHVGGIPIGRMIPSSYQYIMPGDKFAGRNEFSLIAEKLVTPVISDVRFSQHNYFVTFRSVDRGFEELQTPTKNNAMSANLSTPQFSLQTVVLCLVQEFHDFLPYINYDPLSTTYYYAVPGSPRLDFSSESALRTWFNACNYRGHLQKSYLDDALEDLLHQLIVAGKAYSSLSNTSTSDEVKAVFVSMWQIIFDFFCGEGSLMDYFGCPIMRHEDVENWFTWIQEQVLPPHGTTSNDYLDNQIDSFNRLVEVDTDNDIFLGIDNRLIWEYPFRAYYAIWYEHYRNMWLEPRNSDLPDYKDWGSTPLISGTYIDLYICTLLVTRIRPWTDDPFNTNQIDDPCRHVFAPVVGSGYVGYSEPSLPAQDDVTDQAVPSGNNWSYVDLEFVDSNGVHKTIGCPLPHAVSGSFLNMERVHYEGEFNSLDLFTLKKAKMYERFLKRNFAFGDEYRDRVKAQYGVTIEDYRINRPHYLSGSVDSMDIKQEVANGGTYRASVDNSYYDMFLHQGDRLVTMTAANQASDGFEFFGTEFGIYISLFSVLPMAQYDHTDPIIFTQKFQDFPIPAFAMQQEDISNSSEIYRLGLSDPRFDNLPFGHVPYAHGWRYRVDEVHGQMLSSKYDYTFARFYQGLTDDGIPKLNYWFVHCRPNIPMFLNNVLLDGQFYGTFKHNFLVERLLPEPVETI